MITAVCLLWLLSVYLVGAEVYQQLGGCWEDLFWED
jgi:hypothetical protein